ncbi:hypothetical protein [Cryobacterium sp. CG_9.6]|uniref:hypothetical protein n=1 Tax=Cryobacterium sp. CG_9.6 TaxID=2760710 RepID=UPI002475D9A3|nr:hypothetical protein [Cryobacterium sp. CG_9.6]MDH6238114.1 Asp/Glu/hydantoin racemase [Cryobacterium sp. CG_9.6]
MRLLAITPLCVDAGELLRRQQRYNRLAPVGLSIQLLNLGNGSEIPRALNTNEDIIASEAALLARFRAIDTGNDPEANLTAVDAYLPDCVLDPVVDLPYSGLSRPVLGLLKLTAHFLVSLGGTVGAVARNEAIAQELDRKFVSYGLGQPHGATSVLGLSVADIANDEIWARAVNAHLQTMPAHVVINGCSAVEAAGPSGRPVLVDPTKTALQLIALGAAVGAVSTAGE